MRLGRMVKIMRNIWQKLATAVLAVSLAGGSLGAVPAAASSASAESQAVSPSPAQEDTASQTVISVAPIAAGYLHSGVIREDGTLWMAGANTYGQLGNGGSGSSPEASSGLGSSSSVSSEPEEENSSDEEEGIYSDTFEKVMDNVRAVYAKYLTTFAIDGDNTLWVWGWNEGNQLGLNDSEAVKNRPQSLLENVVMAAPGDYHSAAVTEDGGLWTWGWNDSGQLGNGTQENGTAPQRVLEDVRMAAVGMKHTLAVKNDDTLWACGDNTYGQLADGGTTTNLSFIKIMDGVSSVSATAFGTLILKTDGTLWSCGYNNNGEMGDGTFEDVGKPVQILENVAQVSAARSTAAAVGTDGTLYAWGLNDYGQYGGDTSASPMELDTGVSYVNMGDVFLMYLKDVTVYACGNNERGQFGLGTTDNAAVPLPVFEDVAMTPELVSSPVSGPVILVVVIAILAIALFVFLIARTLKGGPADKKKKPVVKPETSQKAEDPEKKLSKLSDAELLRMAEAMNAAAAGKEPEEDDKDR